jgi:hypothetical protein
MVTLKTLRICVTILACKISTKSTNDPKNELLLVYLCGSICSISETILFKVVNYNFLESFMCLQFHVHKSVIHYIFVNN